MFYQHVSTTGKKIETDHYLRKKLGKADSTAITAVPFGLPSRRTLDGVSSIISEFITATADIFFELTVFVTELMSVNLFFQLFT